MPFKIVQTIEHGKPQLSICPSQWESGGLLSWPKKKAAKKSRIVDLPPQPDWPQMNCILKRVNLMSYAAAEEELQAMLENTDTELEQDKNQASCKRYVIEDFNNQAGQLLADPMDTAISPITTFTTNDAFATHNSATFLPHFENQASTDEYVIIGENTKNTANVDASDEVLLLLANITNNQKVLSESLNTVKENQKKIIMTMADFSVKLETLLKNNQSHSLASVTPLKDITNSPSNNAFCLKPIQNLNQLQSLEEELNVDKAKKDYKNKYSIVCSPGKGINCAYQLADVFFNREFLTKCSWSGSARGEGTKISFKTFTNVLHLFFELVHDCDPLYSLEENNNFFKAILKNAVKRQHSKLQRTPTARNTPKRQKVMSDPTQSSTDAVQMQCAGGVDAAADTDVANSDETNVPNNDCNHSEEIKVNDILVDTGDMEAAVPAVINSDDANEIMVKTL